MLTRALHAVLRGTLSSQSIALLKCSGPKVAYSKTLMRKKKKRLRTWTILCSKNQSILQMRLIRHHLSVTPQKQEQLWVRNRPQLIPRVTHPAITTNVVDSTKSLLMALAQLKLARPMSPTTSTHISCRPSSPAQHLFSLRLWCVQRLSAIVSAAS